MEEAPVITPGPWLLQNYDVQGLKGKGSHAKVYAVKPKIKSRSCGMFSSRGGAKPYACKMIKRPKDGMPDKEVQIMKRLKGVKGVVSVKETHEADDATYLVMEYCMDEADLIMDMHEKNMAILISLVAKAIRGMHAAGVVHRNLKNENLLLAKDGYVRVCGFGSATFFDNKSSAKMTEPAGTVKLMAPEMFRGSYGKEVDIYGLGLVMYELVEDKEPFGGVPAEEIAAAALNHEDFPKKYLEFEHSSDAARDLILKMTAVNPSERITVSGILKHPWIREFVPWLDRKR